MSSALGEEEVEKKLPSSVVFLEVVGNVERRANTTEVSGIGIVVRVRRADARRGISPPHPRWNARVAGYDTTTSS